MVTRLFFIYTTMSNIVDKIRNLTGFKKWLVKFLGLTLIISLTFRFALPYCHFALGIPDYKISFFILALIAFSFLFLVIMAFKKKRVYAEPIAIIVSAIIFTSTMGDVLFFDVNYKLGGDLYNVRGELYNKWGIKCVDLGYYYCCVALVEDEKNNEIILGFKKSEVAWGEQKNSEFEVTSYNLSTNKMYNFTFDQYVREELDERRYILIDYKVLKDRYLNDEAFQYHNPFSDLYKNFDKIKDTKKNKDRDYKVEKKRAIENYNEEEDDAIDLSSLDDYSSDEDEWVPSAFREEKKRTSTSKSSSEGSGYDPWINYKNGTVIQMMNTGADIYTGTSVNTSSVTTTSSTSYCTKLYPSDNAHCNGSGICAQCNGKGWYRGSMYGDDNIYECFACGKTGKCPSCGGTGRK